MSVEHKLQKFQMIAHEGLAEEAVKRQARRTLKKLEGDHCQVVRIELLEVGIIDTPRGKYKGQHLKVYYREISDDDILFVHPDYESIVDKMH